MLSAMARPPQRLLLVCLSLSPCLAESIYLFLSPSIHLYNDLHTHIRARTHTRTHSHTHTHTHQHTHMRTHIHATTHRHTLVSISTRRVITDAPWGLQTHPDQVFNGAYTCFARVLRTHTHPLTHVHKCTTRTHAFHPLNQARIASRRSARSSSTKSAWPGCTSAPKEKLRELTWRN